MKTITVTEEHIKNGKPRSPWSCPIAQAVKEQTELSSVAVNSSAVEAGSFVEQRYPLSARARRFIDRFDRGLPVLPFTMELPI